MHSKTNPHALLTSCKRQQILPHQRQRVNLILITLCCGEIRRFRKIPFTFRRRRVVWLVCRVKKTKVTKISCERQMFSACIRVHHEMEAWWKTQENKSRSETRLVLCHCCLFKDASFCSCLSYHSVMMLCKREQSLCLFCFSSLSLISSL